MNQSLAMAYAKSRDAMKRRKMWLGGEVDQYRKEEKENEVKEPEMEDHLHSEADDFGYEMDMPECDYDFEAFSEGGEVEEEEEKPKRNFARAIALSKRKY